MEGKRARELRGREIVIDDFKQRKGVTRIKYGI